MSALAQLRTLCKGIDSETRVAKDRQWEGEYTIRVKGAGNLDKTRAAVKAAGFVEAWPMDIEGGRYNWIYLITVRKGAK